MGIAIEDLLFGLRPARWVWKPLVRRWVTGRLAPLRMRPGEAALPAGLKRLGLYLHVPFCRNLCPYCPYNRIEYDEGLFRRYEAAAHEEIDLVAGRLAEATGGRGAAWPRIDSLYVGGGTPTVDPAGLARLLAHLREAFGAAGDVCVELHPSAMDDECLRLLGSVGVTMLSIGVESLTDRLLALIGRSHDAAVAEDAVRRAVGMGFDAVNVDLMFALPTQTLKELDEDLGRVFACGADQVSTYPIFGFPYTELGHTLGIKGIRRPPGDLVRTMFDLIHARAVEHGFRRCAVWSFLRPRRKKFSSVTRHHYLGFGPSAASMIGRQFYVNTFSVEHYAEALPERLPVALVMPVSRRLEMAYWLYWRAYELVIPRRGFRELFEEDLEAVYGPLLTLLERAGMAEDKQDGCHLTDRAAYWIHRLQNEYSLNYINRLWGRCRQQPWPQEVVL